MPHSSWVWLVSFSLPSSLYPISCVSNCFLSSHLLSPFFLFLFNLIFHWFLAACLQICSGFPWLKIFLLNSFLVSFLSPSKRCWSYCLYYFITYLTSCDMTFAPSTVLNLFQLCILSEVSNFLDLSLQYVDTTVHPFLLGTSPSPLASVRIVFFVAFFLSF